MDDIIMRLPDDNYLGHLVMKRRETELQVEKILNPLRPQMQSFHRELLENEEKQLEYIIKELEPLCRRCYMGRNISIGGTKYDYVYYKITGTPKYEYSHVGGYQSLTELVASEMLGTKIDTTKMYELPAIYIAVKRSCKYNINPCDRCGIECTPISRIALSCPQFDVTVGEGSIKIKYYSNGKIYEQVNEYLSRQYKQVDKSEFEDVLINYYYKIREKYNQKFQKKFHSINSIMYDCDISIINDSFELSRRNGYIDPNDTPKDLQEENNDDGGDTDDYVAEYLRDCMNADFYEEDEEDIDLGFDSV